MVDAWKFYLSPEQAWEGMLAACEAAQVSIDCEQYIFETDEIGQRFVTVFIRKAESGVHVRLLIDGAGSFDFARSPLVERLRAAGVEVLVYNPISLWGTRKIESHFLRDHRKVLVIDTRLGFTGGVGIAARMSGWRDTHVRIEGTLAEEMRESFEKMWRIASHKSRRHFGMLQPPPGPFHVLNNSPLPRHRHIYHALLDQIRTAKKHVYLASPYFVPSIRLSRALLRAARRGVDVRIMLPATSDVRLADIARGIFITRLLHAGAKFYFYTNSVFHPKTGVIDGSWATIGSANLDNLSLLLNYEMNLVSTEQQFVTDLTTQFLSDMQVADELGHASWKKRPLFTRLLEFLIFPLRGIL